jgi:hypothetical protein
MSERLPHLRLYRLYRNPERRRDLGVLESLPTTELEHLATRRRQLGDRGGDRGAQLARDEVDAPCGCTASSAAISGSARRCTLA